MQGSIENDAKLPFVEVPSRPASTDWARYQGRVRRSSGASRTARIERLRIALGASFPNESNHWRQAAWRVLCWSGLALPARPLREDRAACLAAGINDHIAKPVIPRRLYESLLHRLRRADWAPSRPRARRRVGCSRLVRHHACSERSAQICDAQVEMALPNEIEPSPPWRASAAPACWVRAAIRATLNDPTTRWTSPTNHEERPTCASEPWPRRQSAPTAAASCTCRVSS